MFKRIFIFAFLINSFLGLNQIDGVVFALIDGEKKIIEGADVFFKNGKIGKTTCEEGAFRFDFLPKLPDTLIIRSLGYYTDTVAISKKDKQLHLQITLYPDHLLDEFVFIQKRETSSILRLDPRNVENLSSGELRKAACCNLSESFETNATVDVNYTDGISGAKQIAMMGLSGVYTQIQMEGIPIIQNLNLAHGLNTIPGTWIESIQITKGTGTVINGYESMSGLINLEYRKPEKIERLFINGYGNIRGRGELNIHGGTKINEKLGTAWFIQGASVMNENDRNNDGFRDLMIGNDFVGMNRWIFRSERFVGQLGIKGNYSSKLGGQLGYFKVNTDSTKYGVENTISNLEIFGKTGFIFNRPATSLGVIYYLKGYDLNVKYGRRVLSGLEKRAYSNVVFETYLGSTLHKIKSGLSVVYDDLEQQLNSQLNQIDENLELNRTEFVPGAFFEYTYTGLRTDIVAGFREDYHNLFGWQHTPRINIKHTLTENIDLRATAGRGFRVSNYAIDNIGLLATNRQWIVANDIKPEVSWNFGLSYLYQFEINDQKAIFSIDYFHTLFENQLVADRDASVSEIRFYNLTGQSFSNVVQLEFRFSPLKNFDIKTAYKFLDVRATMGGQLLQKMMVPKHRGFVNLSYLSRNKRWEYDLTGSIFGNQRLATVEYLPGQVTTNNISGIFPLLSGQITHVFKKIEVYLGVENLLDYKLNNPIVDVENPFSSRFDATRVWAPIVGINLYGGIRFQINTKND